MTFFYVWHIFLQIWCILLNDKVPFRMHWPLYGDLQVNGMGGIFMSSVLTTDFLEYVISFG